MLPKSSRIYSLMYPWSRGIDLDMGMYAAPPKSVSVLNGQHCDRRR
jgi:hypothetical protein